MAKSKAREELDKDRDFILWLYDNSCIMCGRPTNTIHEVIPVSHGKIALQVNNRVTLCQKDHSWAHDIGTNNSIPILQEKRKEFLIRKFGLENANS